MTDDLNHPLTQRQEELLKARHVVTTSRGLAEYEERLLVNRDNFAGKVIIDLGAGTAEFAVDLADYYQDSLNKPRIVAYDIAYDLQSKGAGKALLEQKLAIIQEKYSDCISLMAGLFSNLPFEAASFDYVLSLYAFPLHIKGEEFFKKGLQEIIRVLAKGGVAKLAPLEYHTGDLTGAGYITYRQKPDHFQQIFHTLTDNYGNIRFNTFQSKNAVGLEIRKI